MKSKILPLGTVVTLNNGDGTEVMIISRASIAQVKGEEEVYFDYGGVVIPDGLQDSNHIFFFNQEDVKQVIFKGYVNLHEQQFEDKYDEIISNTQIPKGQVN